MMPTYEANLLWFFSQKKPIVTHVTREDWVALQAELHRLRQEKDTMKKWDGKERRKG